MTPDKPDAGNASVEMWSPSQAGDDSSRDEREWCRNAEEYLASCFDSARTEACQHEHNGCRKCGELGRGDGL